MKSSDVDILIVPGWRNSGPDHWQSRWQAHFKTARRVEQDDWDRPQLGVWSAQLNLEIAKSTRPVVIVAHSLGVYLVPHGVQAWPAGKVVAAFLVAPPSEAYLATAEPIDPAFLPLPRIRLPFPSAMVVSQDDEFAPFEASEALASDLGSVLVDAGKVGHLNADSGFGPWPDGALRFGRLLSDLGPAPVPERSEPS